jgi:predicted HTH transcriptional regulator
MGALPTTDLDGYKILSERIIGALNLLQEVRSVDFKEAVVWDDLKYKIAKTTMAMSNLRDGGIIIIGIAEQDNNWHCTGMTEEQINTYDPDNMIDHVNKYASPAITFDVVKHTDKDGLQYLAIQAHEFEEKPIVCKKDYAGELRRGVCYIRPLGKAESRAVQSADEMQEVLDLAVDKSVRKFLQRCERLGMLVRVEEEKLAEKKVDSDKFDAELEGL